MCPPPASPLADIGFDCPDEEIFMCLEKMMSGFPPPNNVITDHNPRNFLPSNLPRDIWYLIDHKEDGNTELGFWKVKGESCNLFSNSVVTGWRTTLEFFEGQVPHEHKTDWVMQEYGINKNGLGESSKAKEARLLCRVVPCGGQSLEHENQEKMASPNIASEAHSHFSIVPNAHYGTSNGSTGQLEVNKDDDRAKLDLTGRPPNHVLENPPEDYVSRGDYLEILDLDIPASSSSSSDNSSCCTMSSDEYFDYVALLRDIESESNRGLVQKNEGCKFSISACLTPNETVILPASPESITSMEASKLPTEDILRTEIFVPGLANRRKDLDNRVSQDIARYQKSDYREGVPSSNSHDEGTSSRRHIASCNGEKKAAKARMKKVKKKYSCFMPFSFLF